MTGWRWPIPGAVITQTFYTPTGPNSLHSGLDLAAPFATNVLSPADGVVVAWRQYAAGTETLDRSAVPQTPIARDDPGYEWLLNTYGSFVLLDHGDEFSLHGHTAPTVTRGLQVKAGDPIGQLDQTGYAKGAHDHFERRSRTMTRLDPMERLTGVEPPPLPDDGEEGGMVDQPPIVWVPAHAANYTVGRQGVSPEAVVWHITEGGMPGPWFQDPAAKASTHFGISKTGRIEQYVSLENTAWANGSVEVSKEQAPQLVRDNWGINPNLWTVSIEHEGRSADVKAGTVPTREQQASTAWLTAWLFEDVLFDPAANARPPADRAHIMMHREISPRSKTCPAWNEATHSHMIDQVRGLLVPAPKPPDPKPPTPTDPYRDKYIAELQGIVRMADDDALRAALRKEQAQKKLKAEGL